MANVLSDEKKQQVIALGRLGWTLRRIQRATGVRRETAAAYLKAAGIPVRPPGWERRASSKPATGVITHFGAGKPALGVSPDRTASPEPAPPPPSDFAATKPAEGVTTDSELPPLPAEATASLGRPPAADAMITGPRREARAGACRASLAQSLRQCL